ncbi:hypothetical protein F4677DRAFT_442833 [Hypoxylon crocopeplum]|nr:hypothetical protein F4677DRAFT_442833 [Hypoxylon crocopeplum]
MSSKRRAEAESESRPSKRRPQKYRKDVRSDPHLGQRAVFGDLECLTTVPTGDSDLDCEDDSEALAYLRSVHVQASAIPHIVVANKAGPQLPPQTTLQATGGLGNQLPDGDEERIDRSIYQDGTGDFRGYYQDGAYTAYPPGYFDTDEDEEEDYEDEVHECAEGEEEKGNEELEYDDESSFESSEGGPRNSSSDEIRDAYFAALTNQYLALRNVLQTDPPSQLLSSLPWSNPTQVGGFGPRTDTFSRWSGRLRGTNPLPVQIAGMQKDAIFRLLRIILGGKFLRKKQELRERTSRWIWALLARLPDRGELDYQEIGLIRELGKRAVLLMVSLAEMDILKEHYDVGDSSVESQGDGDVDVDEGIENELSPEGYFDNDDFDTNGYDPMEPSQDAEGSLPEDEDATVTQTNGHKGENVDELASKQTNGIEGKKIVEAEASAAGESSDIDMQIGSDGEEEDGEVSEAPQQTEEPTADIETAKARLLVQLGTNSADIDVNAVADAPDDLPVTALEEEAFRALDAEEEMKEQERIQRARVNKLATLNMILTVAGEFYGQRDLLEFRDPFGGLQVE